MASSISAVTYPVIDSLHNFRLKARLDRVGAGAGSVPSFGTFANMAETGDSRLLVSASLNAGSDTEQFIFRWQQKIFSSRELALYANSANCTTPLQQMATARQRPDYSAMWKETSCRQVYRPVVGKDCTVAGKLKDSAVAERISNVRHRKVAPQNRLPSPVIANPISDVPSVELIKRSRSVSVSSKVMYIMAYLGPKDVQQFDKIDTSDEKILCTIHLINDCQLSLTPDFNQSQSPYRLESRFGVFNFILSDFSPKLTTDIIEDEQNRQAKLKDYRAKIMNAKIGTTFDVPEDGVLKTLVLINIQKAYNFEFDGLFVHYLINLPKGWYTSTPEALQGVTQLCYTASIDQENVANLSVPIEADLCYKWNAYDEEADQEETACPQWPQLFLCVGSVDGWSRYRPEGYGAEWVPREPGSGTGQIRLWRPLDGHLARFFSGPSAEMQSLSLDTISYRGGKTSKIGLESASSGIVTVQWRVIHQCRSYIGPERRRQLKYGALLEQIGATASGGMHWSIIAVLEAFEKARKKMLQTRDQFFYVNKSFESHD